MSPTSSRKIVPPSACSNLPARSCTAPVNEPFIWPNNSLSINSLVCAELGRFDSRLDRRVPADHDDDRARIVFLDATQCLEAVDAGHLHVEKHEMRLPLLVRADPVDGVGHRVHLVALELEQLPKRGANAL